MKKDAFGNRFLCIAVLFFIFISTTNAATTWTGDVKFLDSGVYVGYTAPGTFTVDSGSDFSRDRAFIGSCSGSIGQVTVTGLGSTWTNTFDLHIGDRNGSNGTLRIADGGSVSTPTTYMGSNFGSMGLAIVDGNGSTLNSERLNIGYIGNAALEITNGGSVVTAAAYIADASSSTSQVTVSGSGSALTINSGFMLGNEGKGSLNIVNNGSVTVACPTYAAYYSGSSGTIHFDNGTLTTGGLFIGADDLTGTGTIYTDGLVSDVDLIFDATHGLNQTLTLDDNPEQNITVHLDISSSSVTGAGHSGMGTMSIADGIIVESYRGYIGCKEGSTGLVTVDGNGSTWKTENHLHVGLFGNGILQITNGGMVNHRQNSYVGTGTGSTGFVSVDGIGSTWNAGLLLLGDDGDGTVEVTNHGTLNCNTCSIGNDFGTKGQLTVDGNGSEWHSHNVSVGCGSNGTVEITNGATAESHTSYIGRGSNAVGSVLVDGNGSTWTNSNSIHVGYGGSGTLKIANGGSVTVGQNTYITAVADSSGKINFDNGTLTTKGLFANSADLTGIGTINTEGLVLDADLVFDVAQSSKQTLTLNHHPNQNISINLNINSSSTIGTGYSDAGTMRIVEGIAIESKEGYLGYQAGSTGLATIDGNGTTWNTSWLAVGFEGDGNIQVTNGGTVISETSFIGNLPGSKGRITINGSDSNWTNSDHFHVGRFGNGILEIMNGGQAKSAYASIGTFSDSMGRTTVDGNGSTWAIRDLVVGAEGIGTLDITNGGLVSIDGLLTINQNGSALTSTDANSTFCTCNGDSFLSMATGGMLALKGDASASIIAFFGRIQGTDDVRWWDTSIDTYGGWAPLTTATPGTDYTLEYLTEGDLAGYTLLTVTAAAPTAIPGDANGDGVVNGSDVTILAGNWQHGVNGEVNATWAMGDFNGDGMVDGSDVTILAGNWQYGITTSATAIPEPGVVVMLLSLLAVGLFRRSR